MLDGGVGYVRISSFSASTCTEMVTAVKDLMNQQSRGIIVDVRNNPGGYLSTSVEAAAQFMAPGSVVLYQQSGNGERKTYRTEGGGTAADVPVVVLINKGSASASEILAGAPPGQPAGTPGGREVVWQGHGAEHELSDKSGLRVTTAQWLRCLRRSRFRVSGVCRTRRWSCRRRPRSRRRPPAPTTHN